MKKFIYLFLPALLLVITSCNDKIELEDDNAEYKFQKEMTIQDDKGNSADLIIYAHSQEVLDDQTEDILVLNTSTETNSLNTTPDQNDLEVEEDEDELGETDVFIFVSKHNLNSDVTNFSVRSKLESYTTDVIENRTTKYKYAYGADGVKGVCVEYTNQSCGIEYFKVRLRSKNSSSGSYSKLGSKKLKSEGDTWSWSSSTTYYKYELRIRNFFSCNSSAVITYKWLT